MANDLARQCWHCGRPILPDELFSIDYAECADDPYETFCFPLHRKCYETIAVDNWNAEQARMRRVVCRAWYDNEIMSDARRLYGFADEEIERGVQY